MATFAINAAFVQDDFSGEFDQPVRGQTSALGSFPSTDFSAGIPMSPVGGQTFALGNGLSPPPDAPPIVDTTPPTVGNVAPVAGTGIESTQIITFDIADETALAHVAVFASFADGTVEVIHDGDGFRGNYVGGSNTRSAISGGFSYSILRIGGWLQAPTIEYLPIDTSGNLGVVT